MSKPTHHIINDIWYKTWQICKVWLGNYGKTSPKLSQKNTTLPCALPCRPRLCSQLDSSRHRDVRSLFLEIPETLSSFGIGSHVCLCSLCKTAWTVGYAKNVSYCAKIRVTVRVKEVSKYSTMSCKVTATEMLSHKVLAMCPNFLQLCYNTVTCTSRQWNQHVGNKQTSRK